MKKFICALMAIMLIAMLAGCAKPVEKEEGAAYESYTKEVGEATEIVLSDEGITVDGKAASEDSEAAVYTANDIVFYLEGQGFKYGEGTEADEHSQAEADAHTVVHITKPGTYSLEGKLSLGQVAVDLGEDAEEDPEAVVNLILNGVDITCEVAPAVIFYEVYECGEADEETASETVDTTKAGANVIIADDTVNNINGSHVARIYKEIELNEEGTEVVDSKKLHKYDAAFYSKKTMNVYGGEKGSGILNIMADNEGLDAELHLTLNGGIINIESGNDGINTNEDYISVTTINGGELNILVNGSTGEGDGIDSNGWLVINGGRVTAQACSTSGDAGIDSDMGIYLNGGSVIATGNMLDAIAGTDTTYAVFAFNGRVEGASELQLKNESGEAAVSFTPENDYSYLIVSGDHLKEGNYSLYIGGEQYQGAAGGNMRGMGGKMPMGELPEDFDPSQMQRPEGM